MTKMKEAIDLLKNIAKTNSVMVEDGTAYTKVQDRIEVFRQIWGDTLGICTHILTAPPYHKGDIFIMRAYVQSGDTILATGHAMEIIAHDTFTSTAFVEVAETSAIGRALAAFGLHGGEYASAEEIQNVPHKKEALAKTQEETQSVSDTKELSTDISTRRIVTDDLATPWSEREVDFVSKTLIASGALAKNIGELSAYWSNNEKVIDLLQNSDKVSHQLVVDFFKQHQETLKGK